MDKNGQEWTRMDKDGQEYTRMDKNGQEQTRMDKNCKKRLQEVKNFICMINCLIFQVRNSFLEHSRHQTATNQY